MYWALGRSEGMQAASYRPPGDGPASPAGGGVRARLTCEACGEHLAGRHNIGTMHRACVERLLDRTDHRGSTSVPIGGFSDRTDCDWTVRARAA